MGRSWQLPGLLLWRTWRNQARVRVKEGKVFLRASHGRSFAAAAATSRQKKAGIVDSRPNGPDWDRGRFARRLILPPAPRLSRPSASSEEEDEQEAGMFSLSDHPLLYDASNAQQLQQAIPTLPRSWKGYEPATPLWNHLAALISVTGRPVSVADYMRLCLTHPDYGYYTTNAGVRPPDDDLDFDDVDGGDETSELDRCVIGRDFVTAPEISQVFGECLAVWFRTQWDRLQQQQPRKQQPSFQWVECGPGTGSLAADLIRASVHLEFGSHCRAIHLVEASPVLRNSQRKTLQQEVAGLVSLEFVEDTNRRQPQSVQGPALDALGTISVFWHDTFLDFVRWQQQKEQLPSSADDEHRTAPITFVVCQEFVDALPVYSFEKTANGWRERMVDLAMEEDEGEDEPNSRQSRINITGSAPAEEVMDCQTQFGPAKKPRLRVVLAPEITPPVKTLLQVNENGWIPGEDPTSDVGCIVEVNPEGILLVQDIAQVVSDSGGAALMIDYGHEGSTDSVRAFSRHKQVPFVSQPGLVDVTADVDFAALRNAVNQKMRGLVQAHGPVTQGEFLMAMGLQERVLSVVENDATTDEDAENLYHAMVRLASPDEMGERFKVLAITATAASDESPPPGFDR